MGRHAIGKHAPEFMPDEAEINYRAKAAQWFTLHKWEDALVDRIMLEDDPPIDVVERLVRRYGPDKARELVLRMME